jgi:hypothetical protein
VSTPSSNPIGITTASVLMILLRTTGASPTY